MTNIHPLACIDPKADLGRNVTVGAFCQVGAGVRIGDDCVLHERVSIHGPTTIGARNVIFPCAVLGAAPQDLKYRGGPTQLIIGDDNIIREHVTMHRGTEIDRESGGTTRVGHHNLIMIGTHIAHDATVGNHIIIANNVLIAGHVAIEDYANLGGAVAINHFCTLGRYAFVTGMTRVTKDVPPFSIVEGYECQVRGVNAKGLARWKFPDEAITRLTTAFRLVFGSSSMETGLGEIERDGLIADESVRYFVEFMRRRGAGVHGRSRERKRTDKAADRGAFYAKS